MLRSDVLIRAHKAIGHDCIYKLGQGGFKPNNEWPWDKERECDCSGFVAWCLGVSRQTDSPLYVPYLGHWLETSAVVRDALSPFGMFEALTWVEVRPADVMVYGDPRGGGQGHIGIVSSLGPTRVIHCSKGNYTAHGDAIRETDATLFMKRGAIAARCVLIEDGADGDDA